MESKRLRKWVGFVGTIDELKETREKFMNDKRKMRRQDMFKKKRIINAKEGKQTYFLIFIDNF